MIAPDTTLRDIARYNYKRIFTSHCSPLIIIINQANTTTMAPLTPDHDVETVELDDIKVYASPPLISALIDPVRERRVVWKLDLFIAPVIMMLQLISYLDRSNIGFAATQGLTSDLHLHGTQFNVRVSTVE